MPVLVGDDVRDRYFYRFADPMMQPYIILDGMASGLITDEDLAEFHPEQDVVPTSEIETTATQPLF